jgi:hypothetical protein
VTSIGYYAFSSCSDLTSVTLNSKTIVSKTYTSSSSMKSFFGEQVKEYIIGDDVTSIGNYAFYNCTGLTSVSIPNSVTSIGSSAFSGCSGLTSVTLNSNSIVSKTYTSSSNVKNIFGEQVKEYIIGDGVTSIGNYAFYNCTNLTSVTIGGSVTNIGANAFYGLTALKSIVIPASVESIGSSAFGGCNKLLDVVTLITSPVSIPDNAFSDKTYADGSLYVPAGSMGRYKVRGGWKKFVYMEEGVPTGIDNISNEGAKEAARYTLDGKRVATPQPGLNIVRMTDGNTRKVVVK